MQIISQAKVKQIKALHQKKIRDESGLFLVEGAKTVLETLKSNWETHLIAVTNSFYDLYKTELLPFEDKIFICTEEQLSGITTFKTNNAALLVCRQLENLTNPDPNADLWLVLESISDPGNMGTIIRLADWFGLNQVLTIGDCVEWYNPKVISAGMGSFIRIRQVKSDAGTLLQSGRKSFAAHMKGKSLYDFNFPEKSMLTIGNEAKGISENWLSAKTYPITIPSFGKAESLNAGIATGILLNHFQYCRTRKSD